MVTCRQALKAAHPIIQCHPPPCCSIWPATATTSASAAAGNNTAMNILDILIRLHQTHCGSWDAPPLPFSPNFFLIFNIQLPPCALANPGPSNLLICHTAILVNLLKHLKQAVWRGDRRYSNWKLPSIEKKCLLSTLLISIELENSLPVYPESVSLQEYIIIYHHIKYICMPYDALWHQWNPTIFCVMLSVWKVCLFPV